MENWQRALAKPNFRRFCNHIFSVITRKRKANADPWASAVGDRRAVLPWIFKHGTNIVDRGLEVLFSAFFAIFRPFLPLPPPLLGRG